eukprot:CAMPEP_0206149574 /NCGR_PEP_ID=MMETSP1473-20131121/37854_1 /ASSEMBLY_ACC=CAM_ASM_001109 /TAXON_ID=1461547 /ORGANISM="Stichococcus sp, Strain RCC1054" /LENGTH=53 /DNA_ID=CAMNT_0053547049 /DNA_START=482 /DNA_END=643 /DNA_ORIENTATION=-
MLPAAGLDDESPDMAEPDTSANVSSLPVGKAGDIGPSPFVATSGPPSTTGPSG